jgi:SM-20-related protein
MNLIADGLTDHNLAIADNFISPELTRALRENLTAHYKQGSFHKAGTGRQDDQLVRTEIRSDSILWLEQYRDMDCVQEYFMKIDELMQNFNRTLYLGLQESEIHFAVYPVGTFYKRHLDRFKSSGKRILSFITYLNENWKEEDGGQLVVYQNTNASESKIFVNPDGGRLVCFDSGLIEHEVLPATRERYSITGWMLR